MGKESEVGTKGRSPTRLDADGYSSQSHDRGSFLQGVEDTLNPVKDDRCSLARLPELGVPEGLRQKPCSATLYTLAFAAAKEAKNRFTSRRII